MEPQESLVPAQSSTSTHSTAPRSSTLIQGWKCGRASIGTEPAKLVGEAVGAATAMGSIAMGTKALESGVAPWKCRTPTLALVESLRM